MKRAGFVLVGGQSSRMGRDKALLPLRGQPLVAVIAAVVRDAAGSVTLIGPPERYPGLGLPVVADLVSGCGPLGGIITALTISPADWNLIVGCDMPSLSSDFLRLLLDEAEHSEAACLLPCSPSGRPEPLCAVYHRDGLPALRDALHDGRRKLTDALAGLRVVRYTVAKPAWFENLNTPEDWSMHQEAARLAHVAPGDKHD